MGNLLKHPILDVSFTEMESEMRVSVTCASMQGSQLGDTGWREHMEDFHVAAQIGDELLLAGVFDGHGGPEVARYVSSIIAK
jgi:serine/threonine protein phosphatase PrpC